MKRLISRQDIRSVIYLPLFALFAWILPQSLWNGVAKWLTELPQRIAPIRIRSEERTHPKRLPPAGRATQRVLRQFQYLREIRPGGWHPEIVIENEEIVAESIANGNGVVLWIANTRCADLVAKKALDRIGVKLHHLSRPEHGGSQSPFGKKFLNAIPRIVENRFLKERVSITAGKELGATRRLKEILSKGKVISITASSEGWQTRLVRALDGILPLATGAPALANSTGAALIPVFCVQLPENVPNFRVAFGPSIPIEDVASRGKAIDLAIRHFAAMHEDSLGQYARQWRGFGSMIPSDKLGEATTILEPARSDLTS